jgi:DNA-binding GntR family transcriptional regulator
MDRFEKIAAAMAQKPQTVADRIAGVLREAISDGALEDGAALRQDDLAARFGFSRMPVRDALRQLETEGLVTVHPTKGAFVAPMDGKEITEIYAIRELLEMEALRLSCPKLSEEMLEEAAGVLDQIDAEANVAHWGTLNSAFHMTLYGRCDNDRLLGLIETHHHAADRYVRVLLSNLDYHSRSQEEHRKMLDACRRRDAKTAAAVLRGHLREGSETLFNAVRNRKIP